MSISDISVFSVLTLHRTVITILLLTDIQCLEKTLRKIVRNQSKMVQLPFSHPRTGVVWNNESTVISKSLTLGDTNVPSDNGQVKNYFLKKSRPKMSTIISSMDTGRSKSSYSKMRTNKEEHRLPNELRSVRNTFKNITLQNSMYKGNDSIFYMDEDHNVNNDEKNVTAVAFFPSPFFPHPNLIISNNHDGMLLRNQSNRENIHNTDHGKNKSPRNESIKAPISNTTTKLSYNSDYDKLHKVQTVKTDYLIKQRSSYSNSDAFQSDTYTCTTLFEKHADIDAQTTFSKFNIEPPWTARKQFWNHIFDSRYETLMRNPKWPPLKVILIPRSQVDSIWKKSFESYHTNIVSNILSNVVKKLQFYSNYTFTWNEVSHLSRWWKHTTQKNRIAFRRLLREGRIEVTTGSWVETDEGTSHLFGLVHQLVEGHQWLKNNLNYIPEVAWLTTSVTHSSTMPYLMAASGITYMILTNLHFSWEEYLAEYQHSDFIWIQNWQHDKTGSSFLDDPLNRIGNNRLPEHAVLTHFLQFNSAGFKACGPNQLICTDFNFANKSRTNMDITSYNVKDKSELLLEQYSKSGTLSPHNVILAPIGGPYRYEFQTEFDYQYNNYQKLIDFINTNQDVYKANIEFGIPRNYFVNALEGHKTYPTLKGDFLNYAEISSGTPAYWTGYFTSRPLYKILLRRLQSTLRSTEILFSLAINLNAFHDTNVTHLFPLLIKARESVARLMDRHSVGGTLTRIALKYAHDLISKTVKNCWYIQEYSASCLTTKRNIKNKNPYLHKYVYRDGEFVSSFRTVMPNDKLYLFNSLSYERVEIVELISRYYNLRITDHNNKEITVQINPVWKYNSNNIITISSTYYKIIFMVVIPPMTLELFQIKDAYDAMQSAAVLYCKECVSEDTMNTNFHPFKTQSMERGDIQLESYKLRLTFDERTGFLKTILNKETDVEKNVVINYSAFKSSDKNAGMFLFNTNSSNPLHDILRPFKLGVIPKITLIVVGDITTELTTVFGNLLQHTVKIFNLVNGPLSKALYIESQVDYEYSPKYRELEIFLSIQTDIANGNPPEIISDNNSFQFTSRRLNISKPIESNVYPITSIAYIEDLNSRLNIITDHAQGITALHEGQIIAILDRRVLYNDGRGNSEGLADSSKTYHRHYLILEKILEHDTSKDYRKSNQHNMILTVPSFSTFYLSDSLNYALETFIVNRNLTSLCDHAFLPLIKTALPCDVSLLNFRTNLYKGQTLQKSPNTALMILHRRSFSCQIESFPLANCKTDQILFLENILYRVKIIYKTFLSGTDKGSIIRQLNLLNFPAMELLTLRVHF